MVDQQGYSCSIGVEAQLLYQRYLGSSVQNNDTVNQMYLLPLQSSNDSTQTTFLNNFHPIYKNLTANDINYYINFFSSFVIEAQYSYTDILQNQNGWGTPKITSFSTHLNQDQLLANLQITLKLDRNGAVYFTIKQVKIFTPSQDQNQGFSIVIQQVTSATKYLQSDFTIANPGRGALERC